MNNAEIIQGRSSGAVKALFGSVIGLLIFFIPFSVDADKSNVPLVTIIGAIKAFLGTNLEYITLGLTVLLCITWVASKVTSNAALKRYHRKDNVIAGLLFVLGAVFAALLVFRIGPDWFLHKDVGGLALYLGGSVFLTVIIAGFFVLFLTEFGFLEFVGTLMEPLMRPLYRLPGRSAVDAVASFVAAPAVGIFITNKLYKSGHYTQREAASIATNFSICSLGFFALLASIGGIMDYLPHMIISSFIINFVLAAVVTRIPPLSNKQDIYFDGQPVQETAKGTNVSDSNIWMRACSAAVERASMTRADVFYKYFWEAATFAQKIVAYILSIATIALIVGTYTPVFDYLGVVFEPLLNLLALPDADKIAPTVLLSIAEIALPAIIIAGADVAPMSVFFVCTLSTIQIIFFTESANAMLESDIPLTVKDLVVIFLIRTVLAIPLVALATHLIF
ncbi:YjiH family protein [Oceanisphaera sediminis]|uniref:YjiH family protein n=1 Tax=Oceanisphaera sediminis TaxID=981381 RepID=UPI0031EC5E14